MAGKKKAPVKATPKKAPPPPMQPAKVPAKKGY